jgi:hypothetical protein
MPGFASREERTFPLNLLLFSQRGEKKWAGEEEAEKKEV